MLTVVRLLSLSLSLSLSPHNFFVFPCSLLFLFWVFVFFINFALYWSGFCYVIRYIRPEDVPVQYGGLSRPSDLENGPPKPASEFTVKGGEKVNIQIEGIEVRLLVILVPISSLKFHSSASHSSHGVFSHGVFIFIYLMHHGRVCSNFSSIMPNCPSTWKTFEKW